MKPGILFLDDDKTLLSSIKRYLHKYKNIWEMHFAENYEDALHILGSTKIDVALLDVFLPVKNGFDLLNYIKSNKNLKDIEIVMLTGMKEQQLKRVALSAGASDLLQKPIQPEDLIARINSTLHVKQYHDQIIQKNKILEEELVKSQKMEITGVLAAGITHDIRNILMVITNYPYIIEKKLNEKECIKEELEKIRQASRRAESLLHQILNFAKKDKHDIEEIDINSIVTGVKELLVSIMPHNIELSLNLSDGKLSGFYSEMDLIQIIMNLILNARDAIELKQGQIEIFTARELYKNSETGTEEQYNKIQVSDNGKGMSEEISNKIFSANFTTKEGTENFGFGLSVIRLLVKKLNGIIEVESKEGEGTSFKIYLPTGESSR